MQKWMLPLASPSSRAKLLATTTSDGVAMLANCGCISERWYSSSSGKMPSHAFRYSVVITSSSFWMMRFSVAEKSRPSMRVANLPAPPNSASMTAKMSDGSQITSPWPRNGLTWTMLKLVGTAISRRNAEYFITLTPPSETSGLFLRKLKRPRRMLRAKRSITISIVGMRPRTMRSWFARL